MKLYIVLHIIYLCEKPDSVEFLKKTTPNFLIQKRIFRVKFPHNSDLFSSYKRMVFSSMEARFRRNFMRIMTILSCLSDFPDKNFLIFCEKGYSGSKGSESRLKLDIFNHTMLHKCSHALGAI